MSRTKLLSVLLAVVAVSALALGSAGFSSVSADRSVSVSVVDNEDAYVGVAACELGASNSGEETTAAETTTTAADTTETDTASTETAASPSRVRLWVGNNFSSPFTVERISSGEQSRYPGVEVEPGELVRFNALDDTGSLVVYVAGEGGSFSVEVTVNVVPKDACPFDRRSGNSVDR
jgi:hypothetical protein